LAQKPLPLKDHVLRFAASGRCRRDHNDKIIGLLPQAFALRENELFLSVTWREYFDGTVTEQNHAAVRAIRASMKKGIGPNSAYGIAHVGAIITASLEETGRNLRILHHFDRKNPNPAHSGIHNLTNPEQKLLDLLASDVFAEIILETSVPKR
jgi:hypothetical protein